MVDKDPTKPNHLYLMYMNKGGICGAIVIDEGNGHGETGSNFERGWLHFM